MYNVKSICQTAFYKTFWSDFFFMIVATNFLCKHILLESYNLLLTKESIKIFDVNKNVLLFSIVLEHTRLFLVRNTFLKAGLCYIVGKYQSHKIDR